MVIKMKPMTKTTFCVVFLLAAFSCENKPSLEDLRVQLESPNEAVRDGAAEALAAEGDRAGFEYFMAVARGHDIDRRHYAVARLGDYGDTEAVPLLVGLLEEADSLLAQTITRSLGQLPDDRSVTALIEALTQGDFDQRMNAGYALETIGDIAVDPLIAEWDRLGNHTLHGPAKVVETLGRIKNPNGLRVLVEALGYGEVNTRRKAVEALSEFGPAAEPVLREALSSEKEVVRVNAQTVLDKL